MDTIVHPVEVANTIGDIFAIAGGDHVKAGEYADNIINGVKREYNQFMSDDPNVQQRKILEFTWDIIGLLLPGAAETKKPNQ